MATSLHMLAGSFLCTVLAMSTQTIHRTHTDALTARRDIAVRLRTIRLRAGLTGKDLATLMGCDPSKVSRIENVTTMPTVPDIHAWCVACSAKDQEEDLVAASVAADQAFAAWRTEQRGGLVRLQRASDTLYAKTKRLRAYESQVVPSLLQIEDYAAVILGRHHERRGSHNDVREAAAARYGFRQYLTGGGVFSYVVEEFVLRSRIGSDDVMRAQLAQLIDDTRLPQVSIGVIPLDVPRDQWPTESFYIYDDGLIRAPLVSGRWAAKTPGDIGEYLAVFESLSGLAVVGDEARNIIRQAMPG
jgi:transcriptional regulator with XRE-family HTH domain